MQCSWMEASRTSRDVHGHRWPLCVARHIAQIALQHSDGGRRKQGEHGWS